jgi:hypothetical protein
MGTTDTEDTTAGSKTSAGGCPVATKGAVEAVADKSIGPLSVVIQAPEC